MEIVILEVLHHAAVVQVVAAVHAPVAGDKIFLAAISLNYLNYNKLDYLKVVFTTIKIKFLCQSGG